MLRRLLAADIVFDFRIAPELPDVEIDAHALEQIVMNLVLNASDAMAAGGTLVVAAEPSMVDAEMAAGHGAAPGTYLRLAISDTGVGIPPAILARVFEPFFSTKGDRGTGMGLATVYGTVDQAGGWIDVHSVVGEATRSRSCCRRPRRRSRRRRRPTRSWPRCCWSRTSRRCEPSR